MELGKHTGSLVNHIMSSGNQSKPGIGTPATLLGQTDRYAATITAVFERNGRTFIEVKLDTSTVIRGSEHDGTAEYQYTRNPKESPRYFRLENNGEWVGVWFNPESSRWVKNNTHGIAIGHRETYYDPTF